MALRQKPTAVKNPTPFVISEPQGIDEIITSLQIAFSDNLPWLDKSFGKATKMYHNQELGEGRTADVFFPGIWIGKDQDPLILLGSDNFKAYTFSYPIDTALSLTPEATNQTQFERPLAVIFWFNLHEVDSTKDYPFIEELIIEIEEVISNTSFAGGNGVQVLNYTDDPEQIFAEWSVELVRNQFLVYPHAGVRFNLNAVYDTDVNCTE